MTTRIIALVLALAVSALVASGHPAPQPQSIPPIDEPLARVRVRAADVAALNARLVAGGYDGPVCLEVIGAGKYELSQKAIVAAESYGYMNACLKSLGAR